MNINRNEIRWAIRAMTGICLVVSGALYYFYLLYLPLQKELPFSTKLICLRGILHQSGLFAQIWPAFLGGVCVVMVFGALLMFRNIDERSVMTCAVAAIPLIALPYVLNICAINFSGRPEQAIVIIERENAREIYGPQLEKFFYSYQAVRITVDEKHFDDADVLQRLKKEARKLGADGIFLPHDLKSAIGYTYVGNSPPSYYVEAVPVFFTNEALKHEKLRK